MELEAILFELGVLAQLLANLGRGSENGQKSDENGNKNGKNSSRPATDWIMDRAIPVLNGLVETAYRDGLSPAIVEKVFNVE